MTASSASFAGLKIIGHGPHPGTGVPGITIEETATATKHGAMFSSDSDDTTLRMVFPIEKTLSEDIGRFLVKVGIELAVIHDESWQAGQHRFTEGARYVRGRGKTWNYAFLPRGWYSLGIPPVFTNVPEVRAEIRQRHFDFSLVEINRDMVFFFQYVFLTPPYV